MGLFWFLRPTGIQWTREVKRAFSFGKWTREQYELTSTATYLGDDDLPEKIRASDLDCVAFGASGVKLFACSIEMPALREGERGWIRIKGPYPDGWEGVDYVLISLSEE
jgi:hypothetical protein